MEENCLSVFEVHCRVMQIFGGKLDLCGQRQGVLLGPESREMTGSRGSCHNF